MKSVALIALFTTFAAGSACAQTASFRARPAAPNSATRATGWKGEHRLRARRHRLPVRQPLERQDRDAAHARRPPVGSVDAQGEFMKGLTSRHCGRQGRKQDHEYGHRRRTRRQELHFYRDNDRRGVREGHRAGRHLRRLPGRGKQGRVEPPRRPQGAGRVRLGQVDWRTPGKTITLDLVSLKPAANSAADALATLPSLIGVGAADQRRDAFARCGTMRAGAQRGEAGRTGRFGDGAQFVPCHALRLAYACR